MFKIYTINELIFYPSTICEKYNSIKQAWKFYLWSYNLIFTHYKLLKL
jgi:hypothetical protein